ncbi:MAG: ParB/RepB/Spo0J family partition protein [Candidatus Enteromonas sp.]|nr:ParB/RepB/Spo0J family partition protein [Candidatus Enteromonas sp.]MDY6093480.1 ParB/RepB/Spo0J family partition protein [Candidatus Enteromonas sp.]
MSAPEKPNPISGSLSSLIEKFSHSDVIAEMEKEYQSAPTKLLSISLIDDNHYVEEVILPDEVVESFISSLQKKGFYNPVVVRRKENDRYELILGRKRFFAAKKAGMLSLPSAVLEVGDEETLLMLLADTRDQREFNVVEMALVCQALSSQFHYTQQMLADLSHQSRSQITNTMRILKLPRWVRKEMCLGRLSYGHARAIASLPTKEAEAMVKRIQSEKLSVRATERIIRNSQKEATHMGEFKGIEDRFGAKILLEERSATFVFNTPEELRKFLRKLRKKLG